MASFEKSFLIDLVAYYCFVILIGYFNFFINFSSVINNQVEILSSFFAFKSEDQLRIQLSYINNFFMIGFVVSFVSIVIQLLRFYGHLKSKLIGKLREFKVDFIKIFIIQIVSFIFSIILFFSFFRKFTDANGLFDFGYFYTAFLCFLVSQAVSDVFRYIPLIFWSHKGAE